MSRGNRKRRGMRGRGREEEGERGKLVKKII
jgi:hypothetical protein